MEYAMYDRDKVQRQYRVFEHSDYLQAQSRMHRQSQPDEALKQWRAIQHYHTSRPEIDVSWHYDTGTNRVTTDLEVDITTGKRATVAKVVARLPTGLFRSTGEAITHPDDKYDEDVGVNLATARALQSLAKQLERKAASVVSQVDNTRRQREQANARKVEEPQGTDLR